MNRLARSVILAVTMLFVSSASHATLISLSAVLNGATEVPPTGSPGTGLATVLLDTTAQTMEVIVTFSGLIGLTTASHIHCCAPPGTNAMVATTVPTFPGFPLGVTSGSYDHLFDLTSASTYNPAFVTVFGGTVASAEAALIFGLLHDQTYLNIHTNVFPGGEIRGILVPEPATLVLLALGLAGLGFVRRKQ